MATRTCGACDTAVEVPDGAPGRFACPSCGNVLDAPRRSSVSADAETPPDGSRAIDPERHEARVRAAAAIFKGSRRGPTTGRTDAGGAMALLGITVGVPALFVSPWLNPLVLGLAGMVCCLIGLTLSRDRLLGALGILLCAACAGGGLVLEPHVHAIAARLGLVDVPVEPEPNYYAPEAGG